MIAETPKGVTPNRPTVSDDGRAEQKKATRPERKAKMIIVNSSHEKYPNEAYEAITTLVLYGFDVTESDGQNNNSFYPAIDRVKLREILGSDVANRLIESELDTPFYGCQWFYGILDGDEDIIAETMEAFAGSV